MKITMTVLSLMVVLGVLYGAAKMGMIPTQQYADQSPALAPILTAMHLAKPRAHKIAAKPAKADKTAAAPSPAPQPPAPPAAPPTPPAPPPTSVASANGATPGAGPSDTSSAGTPQPASDSGAKLTAIYDTMAPDDIARICDKLPDPVVIQTLSALDENKAGKILAALPADRAARLTQRMMAGARTAANPSAPAPQSNLP